MLKNPEVREVLLNAPKYRFIEKGRFNGEHLYLALGKTNSDDILLCSSSIKKTKKRL